MDNRLNNAIQENLLILLCFDSDHARIIHNSVDLDLFEGHYHKIAERCYAYIKKYRRAPKNHIADLLSDILDNKSEKRRARVFKDILVSLYEARDDVNTEYVMNEVSLFIRRQTFKDGIQRAAELVMSDNEEDLDEAEVIINESTKKRLDLFHPGVFLGDSIRSMQYLEQQDDSFKIGIPELDRRSQGPTRKELMIMIGKIKAGKTWLLQQVTKMCMLQRLKVVYISLEMSENRLTSRFVQNLFSLPKRAGTFPHTVLDVEEDSDTGHLTLHGFDEITVKKKDGLFDPGAKKLIKRRIKRWGIRLNRIVVRQFPGGTLTINQLRAYLDSLEAAYGFIPDVIVVDYATLMKLDPRHIRTDLGQNVVGLRAIAVERNAALVTALQSSKKGAEAETILETHVAEDWSTMATADLVLTYSQTKAERILGLARLYVAAGRNDEDKYTVLITQDYKLGQVVLDSTLLVSDAYWDILKSAVGDVEEEEEVEDEDNE